MHVGLSELHDERGDLAAARRAPAARPRARRPPRAAEAPLPLADRRGPRPRGRRRPGRRARPARRGGAGLRRRLLPRRPTRRRRCGPGCGSGRDGWTDALAWAADAGCRVDDELSYLREFEHVTLARALLAEHGGRRRALAGVELLGRLLAGGGGRAAGAAASWRSWCCRRWRTSAGGDLDAAPCVARARALTLAEPEGYVRTFVDEGAPDGGPAARPRPRRARLGVRRAGSSAADPGSSAARTAATAGWSSR